MSESASYSTTLRRSIIGIAHPQILATTWFTTGHDRLDLELGGGLARGRLHEVFTGCPDDMGSASGFAMMLTLRARRPGAAILWLRTDNAERRSGCFHAPGFAELGGDPEAVILGLAPDDVSLLRCAADAARCAGLRSEEHTSELQSLMRISYAGVCLTQKK